MTTHAGSRSLWLHPRRNPLRVRLRRWAEYPYFIESLAEHGELPERVTVRWEPYADFTKYAIDAGSEEEAEEEQAFIDHLAERIERGDDVPPLVRSKGEIWDGRHRAFAAQQLGMPLAPVLELVYATPAASVLRPSTRFHVHQRRDKTWIPVGTVQAATQGEADVAARDRWTGTLKVEPYRPGEPS
jgi:hypothetical protein